MNTNMKTNNYDVQNARKLINSTNLSKKPSTYSNYMNDDDEKLYVIWSFFLFDLSKEKLKFS